MLNFNYYNKYFIQFHLLEKLVVYCNIANGSMVRLPIVDFRQISAYYSSNYSSTKNKFSGILKHLFHAFFFEKMFCKQVSPVFVHTSISDFKILSGQLSGFSVNIFNKCLIHNFLSQYWLANLLSEKGFSGLVFCSRSLSSCFGFINFAVHNIYIFPEIMLYFERISELIPNFQMFFNVNVGISTGNIWGIILFFTHIQIPLHINRYYEYL